MSDELKYNYPPEEENIITTLKLSTTSSDLLSDEERETHDLVLNTFEKIASNNMFGSMKAVIDTVADELNMQPSDIAKILDAHYTEEED